MATVDTTSRLNLLFELAWGEGNVQFRERRFARRVSMWRDIFPGAMDHALLGRSEGEAVTVTVDAPRFSPAYQEGLRRTVRSTQFLPPEVGFDGVTHPRPGRFYPQRLLRGVPGAFAVSLAPCRYVTGADGMLLFDLNHPLAGRDLQVKATVVTVNDVADERGGRCVDWLEVLAADGPGMQARYRGEATDFFAGHWNRRLDEADDGLFYAAPRLVQHFDATTLGLLGAEYAGLLPPGPALDLMAGWDSHLEEAPAVAPLTVLGMNWAELDRNGRAEHRLVQDLNRIPRLPFADGAFSSVICTAAIEYLIDPFTVCREISRVLRPDGLVAIAFTNRWFPPKAIALWGQLHEFERVGMVLEMLGAAGGLEDFSALSVRGYPRPAGDRFDQLTEADPLYLVSARKAPPR
jgi:hypothetical protein